ncbi:MAG: OB-fold domain-containing protein, partial [Proteobacteria bacterium]|nr:OB-fold domain-containing protein [Pseudomonadota bacterium]
VVRTRAPYQLPEPYAVGYIDLDASGLRVFGLFHPQATERLRIAMRVALSVMPLGVDNDGRPCLRPVFSPLSADLVQPDERTA